MARRKLVAGNWKMNGSRAALAELDGIAKAAQAAPNVDVAMAVPFTLIAPAAERVPGLAIGAEDVHERDSGAHTGCVSAGMVQEAGARFTIVGHSERRADQGETSQDAWAKAAAAHRQGLNVILCCGETEAERNAGRAERASANFRETWPIFIALALGLAVTGRSGGIAATGAWVWFLARVAYVPLYIFGVRYVRSLAYLVSMVGLVMMLIRFL